MLSVDTTGQSSHLPEPILSQERLGRGGVQEEGKAPGAGNAIGESGRGTQVFFGPGT